MLYVPRDFRPRAWTTSHHCFVLDNTRVGVRQQNLLLRWRVLPTGGSVAFFVWTWPLWGWDLRTTRKKMILKQRHRWNWFGRVKFQNHVSDFIQSTLHLWNDLTFDYKRTWCAEELTVEKVLLVWGLVVSLLKRCVCFLSDVVEPNMVNRLNLPEEFQLQLYCSFVSSLTSIIMQQIHFYIWAWRKLAWISIPGRTGTRSTCRAGTNDNFRNYLFHRLFGQLID